MLHRYLLDTNVLAEPLRPRPNERVLRALDFHAERLVTAAVVVHEMLFGRHRLPASHKRDQLDRFLNDVVRYLPTLTYDKEAAAWHAEQRSRLVAAGKTPTFLDGQIAAIAAVNDVILVTANTKDYIFYRELRLEDWSAE